MTAEEQARVEAITAAIERSVWEIAVRAVHGEKFSPLERSRIQAEAIIAADPATAEINRLTEALKGAHVICNEATAQLAAAQAEVERLKGWQTDAKAEIVAFRSDFEGTQAQLAAEREDAEMWKRQSDAADNEIERLTNRFTKAKHALREMLRIAMINQVCWEDAEDKVIKNARDTLKWLEESGGNDHFVEVNAMIPAAN
jgi:chromosome segregation ATPase